MQRLAFFDLDDTLVDSGRGFAEWARLAGLRYAAERAGARGPAVEHPESDHAADVAHAIVQAADTVTVKLSGSIRVVFDEASRTTGDPALAPWLDARFESEYPQSVACFPGVLDGLARLRDAGWTIGIVTNGPTGRQLAKILASGLDAYVDGWVISQQAGVAKPDRGIFEQAAGACAVELDGGGWMVGDSLSADVGGGVAAGLRTAWIVGTDGGVDAARERLVTAPVMPELVLDTAVEAIGLILAG